MVNEIKRSIDEMLIYLDVNISLIVVLVVINQIKNLDNEIVNYI